jgi:hypothetical protein
VDATVGVDADVDLDAEGNVAVVTNGENGVEHETDTGCGLGQDVGMWTRQWT